jgi:hypothetical protein
MKSTLVFAILSITTFILPTTLAAGLTITHEGSGNGTLNGVPFATSDFVITAAGNVRESISVGWSMDHTSASIRIVGLGEVDFISGSRTFVNNNTPLVGFGRPGFGGDLYNGPSNSALSSWDMQSSIGPIVGSGLLFQWDLAEMDTTGGILMFNSSYASTTFTAAIPEPSTLALTALALLGMSYRRRKQA